MDLSIFLAKVFGLYLVITALAVFFNLKNFSKITSDFANNWGLIAYSGFVNLLLGLALVIAHNVWVPDWRIFITILAWMALLKGILRIFMPQLTMRLVSKFDNPKTMILWITPFSVLGIYLVYVGFLS